MVQPNTTAMLEQLKTCIRSGLITPTKKIDLDTFICFTQATPSGKTYHQMGFEQLPDEHKQIFFGKKVGDFIGSYKIIAIFDLWNIESDLYGEVKKCNDAAS